MDNRPPTDETDRFLTCPKCHAVSARTETLGRAVVYVRCEACGEAWTIPERRKTARQNRTPRFPPSTDPAR